MPNSDLKLLGEKVRTERKLAGLTQEQLAERCHVSTKHIANIEKGSMNPSYEILLAIARVLPISLDALITPGMDKTEVELKEFNRIYGIAFIKKPYISPAAWNNVQIGRRL